MAAGRFGAAANSALEEAGSGAFLGQAISRYDVDELDELGKQPRREKFVEVRRPDGTVAKSRGERTFYGAFTGGFSAGYWGTVGSKEGFQPASFVSSRSKRDDAEAVRRIEDIMDDEDLQDHRASHRTIEARPEYASGAAVGSTRARQTQRTGVASSTAAALPSNLREEIFGAEEATLGARLLDAAAPQRSRPQQQPQLALESAAAAASPAALALASSADALASAGAPLALTQAPAKPKRVYGAARPPGLETGSATASAGDVMERSFSSAAASAAAVPHAIGSALLQASSPAFAGSSTGARRLEAELQRLWKSKVDLHGVGYGLGGSASASSSLLSRGGSQGTGGARRLYLSSAKSRLLDAASRGLGYGDFGTGVLDMDEHNDWEDVYDCTDKRAHYDLVLIDDEEEESGPAPRRLEDADASTRPSRGNFELPGFAVAERTDEDASAAAAAFGDWLAPPAPRSFRGVHAPSGRAAAEAREGSAEHRALLAFLAKHSDRRLLDPASRSELLGDPSGRGASSSTASAGAAGPSAGRGAEATPNLTPEQAASGPLWRGPTDAQKDQVLRALGCKFVIGRTQDMDGKKAVHEPFALDPAKQRRYAHFCLALEGKASAQEALREGAALNAQEREAELLEFGRVYRTFRQANPDADLRQVVDAADEISAAPVLRRTVQVWKPTKLLCKRWGVPMPDLPADAELPAAKRQREYEERVRKGISKATGRGGFDVPPEASIAPAAGSPAGTTSAGTAAAAGAPTVAPAGIAGAVPPGDPPRPPKSLFTSIFGDDEDDDD
eukprot:TRINITY_DN15435_c2_g2_i1.p1 TRINITY_DN15435_c2_g2~~TRINITY_DN15435_c2_g2_i1.p1  ORF type:complete len:789 (+),score=194.66 TRINITY_DN15435_c2_g2_i1:68-2434(+)